MENQVQQTPQENAAFAAMRRAKEKAEQELGELKAQRESWQAGQEELKSLRAAKNRATVEQDIAAIKQVYPDFAATGIDRATDYYNSKHVNYLGAKKYTAYLTAYIKENYDLPDHRGDKTYSLWEEGYAEYLEYVKDGTQETIE